MAASLEQEIRTLRSLFWSDRDPGGRAFAPLADAYRRSGELDEALELLRDGLGRLPDFASGHFVAGLVHSAMRHGEGATRSFERVLELDSANVVARQRLEEVRRGEFTVEEPDAGDPAAMDDLSIDSDDPTGVEEILALEGLETGGADAGDLTLEGEETEGVDGNFVLEGIELDGVEAGDLTIDGFDDRTDPAELDREIAASRGDFDPWDSPGDDAEVELAGDGPVEGANAEADSEVELLDDDFALPDFRVDGKADSESGPGDASAEEGLPDFAVLSGEGTELPDLDSDVTDLDFAYTSQTSDEEEEGLQDFDLPELDSTFQAESDEGMEEGDGAFELPGGEAVAGSGSEGDMEEDAFAPFDLEVPGDETAARDDVAFGGDVAELPEPEPVASIGDFGSGEDREAGSAAPAEDLVVGALDEDDDGAHVPDAEEADDSEHADARHATAEHADDGHADDEHADDEPEEGDLYTRTMGELYARQGLYSRSVEVYEHLLECDPANREFRDRLHELRELAAGRGERPTELASQAAKADRTSLLSGVSIAVGDEDKEDESDPEGPLDEDVETMAPQWAGMRGEGSDVSTPFVWTGEDEDEGERAAEADAAEDRPITNYFQDLLAWVPGAVSIHALAPEEGVVPISSLAPDVEAVPISSLAPDVEAVPIESLAPDSEKESGRPDAEEGGNDGEDFDSWLSRVKP